MLGHKLVCAAGLCVIAWSGAWGQSPMLERPPSRAPGDAFTYNWSGEMATWTYVGKSGGYDCFEVATSTQHGTLCRDAEDNAVSVSGWRSLGLRVSIHLSFPLYVGKAWEYSYATKPAEEAGTVGHRLGGNHTQKLKVTAYERMTVPAGSFDAYKIEGLDQDWGATDVDNLLLYYSPQVGYLKRRIWYTTHGSEFGDSSLELVAYRPAH